MSEAATGPVRFTGTSDQVIDWLRANGVQRVRVEYCDYGGVSRGKAMDIAHFERTMHHGVAFCATVMAFDISANVVLGTDYGEAIGYADFIAVPDLSSMRILRHEPDTALVMGTMKWPRRSPGRGRAPQRAAPGRRAHGGDGLRRPLRAGVRVLPPGQRAREARFRRAVLLDAEAHPVPGRGVFAARRGRRPRGARMQPLRVGAGQYEVSIRHRPVLEMGDDGHLFRATMKEAAMQMGRRVTFMAKPFDKMTGNSCHIHMSLVDGDGNNAFAAPDEPQHINDTCRHFMGGVLARLTELTAVFFPNSNSYRRLVPGAFAPISLAWGVDNRTAAIRLINEAPAATRPELGSAAATSTSTLPWLPISQRASTASPTRPTRARRRKATSTSRT